MSIGETLDPLIGSMLRYGLVASDDLGLGLRTDVDGALVRADGGVEPCMRFIGALRRGDLWETTAVPELRAQALAIATSLARELGCGTAPPNAVEPAPRGAIGVCA